MMFKLEQDAKRKEAQERMKELYGSAVPMLDYSKGKTL